jgi:formamidopyrimidine-DNA glycosylase
VPELPEVETVRRGLVERVGGREIVAADIRDERLTMPADPRAVAIELVGERIDDVGRRGKYLVFALGSGRSFVVHLRMTGWFHHVAGEPVLDGRPYLRATFALSDGGWLLYTDQRRFGTMRLVEPEALPEFWRRRVGPEPLSPEWTPRAFRAALRGRRAPIKALLLAQDVVAGVGNIYADEALWDARIHPLREGGTLTAPEARRLHTAVVAALERGIASRGASISTYRTVDGEQGAMQERFAVYDRAGEPCPRCGTPIEKIRVAQRGTHLCPREQRLPRVRPRAA